jgi:hypothetical protein
MIMVSMSNGMAVSCSGIRRIRKIAESDRQLHHVCPSPRNIWAVTGRIVVKFGIGVFMENLSGKIKFY